MKIYWQVGTYGESDDNLLRAIIRFIKKYLRVDRKVIRFKIYL